MQTGLLNRKYERGITISQITRIRKEVATIANRINKKINDLSAAFRRAWQIVKGRQLISKVSGVTFGTRQKALKKLEKYDTGVVNVALERDEANTYDVNAIKVMVHVGSGDMYHLGFLPKDLAATLAPLLDKGIELTTIFRGVTGGYEGRETYGALICVQM